MACFKGIDDGRRGIGGDAQGTRFADLGEIFVTENPGNISSLEEGKVVEGSREIVRPGRVRIIGCEKGAVGVEVDGASANGKGGFGGSADVLNRMGCPVLEDCDHKGRALSGCGVVSDCNKIPCAVIAEIQRVGMSSAGYPVPIAEKNSHAVSWRSTEIDPDAVGSIGGSAHGFIDSIEWIEGIRAHPPADGELVTRTYCGVCSKVDATL